MSDVEFRPATGVYLIRNAATKTMIDQTSGSSSSQPNAVQGYEKHESEGFTHQYWYTISIGNPDQPNAYYIQNIGSGQYLTIGSLDSGATNVTAANALSDPEERKMQQWLFWEGKQGLCRIQNLARREENTARGFVQLARNSADNFVPVTVDLRNDNLTQQWRIMNRTRTPQEVAKVAGESAPSLLKGVTALIPPSLYLQMPNIMFQIIQGKYTDSGDIIKQGKANFDKTQIFAFKHMVDKWANSNIRVYSFQILAGLAFGQQAGAAKTAVWGLRDDDLDSIMYYDLQKGQVQNSDPTFTPSNSFF